MFYQNEKQKGLKLLKKKKDLKKTKTKLKHYFKCSDYTCLEM